MFLAFSDHPHACVIGLAFALSFFGKLSANFGAELSLKRPEACKGPIRLLALQDRDFNGEGGIRTHGSFHFAGFQDQSHQPLDHLSRGSPGPTAWGLAILAPQPLQPAQLLGAEAGDEAVEGRVHHRIHLQLCSGEAGRLKGPSELLIQQCGG